jgi:hypothetical protein
MQIPLEIKVFLVSRLTRSMSRTSLLHIYIFDSVAMAGNGEISAVNSDRTRGNTEEQEVLGDGERELSTLAELIASSCMEGTIRESPE